MQTTIRMSTSVLSMLFAMSAIVARADAPLTDAQSIKDLVLPVKGSGTPGRITKWVDRRTVGDSAITEVNGNVGVGTTTPNAKLTVTGAVRGGSPENPIGVVLSVTNTAPTGSAIEARGGGGDEGAEGVRAFGGDGTGIAGEGVTGAGGRGPTGGAGVNGGGGIGTSGAGGTGVAGAGGFSVVGAGGRGVSATGGRGALIGGDGIVATAGLGFNGVRGRAGAFNGNVDVTGTLTKGGGAFKIDHPLDPTNRFLAHSFVESPDMMNIYNGNATTDQNGVAVITLPEWFEALNQDFRYQLTVIGSFSQAMVAEKILGNRFTVRTSGPNVEVSWQVTGVRHDPWAERNRIPVEQDKSTSERGHYLYPEAYAR